MDLVYLSLTFYFPVHLQEPPFKCSHLAPSNFLKPSEAWRTLSLLLIWPCCSENALDIDHFQPISTQISIYIAYDKQHGKLFWSAAIRLSYCSTDCALVPSWPEAWNNQNPKNVIRLIFLLLKHDHRHRRDTTGGMDMSSCLSEKKI